MNESAWATPLATYACPQNLYQNKTLLSHHHKNLTTPMPILASAQTHNNRNQDHYIHHHVDPATSPKPPKYQFYKHCTNCQSTQSTCSCPEHILLADAFRLNTDFETMMAGTWAGTWAGKFALIAAMR